MNTMYEKIEQKANLLKTQKRDEIYHAICAEIENMDIVTDKIAAAMSKGEYQCTIYSAEYDPNVDYQYVFEGIAYAPHITTIKYRLQSALGDRFNVYWAYRSIHTVDYVTHVKYQFDINVAWAGINYYTINNCNIL